MSYHWIKVHEGQFLLILIDIDEDSRESVFEIIRENGARIHAGVESTGRHCFYGVYEVYGRSLGESLEKADEYLRLVLNDDKKVE
ncbi:hypothetical protein ACFVS2_25460 [Brevibacillus sp. NPDC058079]|uniref:hypothetical protein n=1 Tax=Brevibacillus sp. NPDC058079 TaxID=3346330 RepID=UPI0036E97462